MVSTTTMLADHDTTSTTRAHTLGGKPLGYHCLLETYAVVFHVNHSTLFIAFNTIEI
jgi:hypothetical protein